MKHFAAYALLVLGGNTTPSAADVEKLLTAAGLKADDGKAAELVKALEGKNFHEHVAEGLSKMSSMGSAAPAQAAAAPKTEEKAAPKKEEKPVEEEEDLDMGDLFGY